MLQVVQPYVVHVVEHGNFACDGIQFECLLHAMLLVASKDHQLMHCIVAHDVCVDVEELQSQRELVNLGSVFSSTDLHEERGQREIAVAAHAVAQTKEVQSL